MAAGQAQRPAGVLEQARDACALCQVAEPVTHENRTYLIETRYIPCRFDGFENHGRRRRHFTRVTGTGDAWTAAVTLDSGVATGALQAGTTVLLTGPGGARTTLTVSSVSTTDAATAETASRTVGSGPRLVLLQVDPATGKVLVVTAT